MEGKQKQGGKANNDASFEHTQRETNDDGMESRKRRNMGVVSTYRRKLLLERTLLKRVVDIKKRDEEKGIKRRGMGKNTSAQGGARRYSSGGVIIGNNVAKSSHSTSQG